MAEQERINKNVNELSQKLLEGCKLLSDSCPETNVPLVSTKDGRMYSVRSSAEGSRVMLPSTRTLPVWGRACAPTA
jgi:MinD superfamily P-loop ATPase